MITVNATTTAAPAGDRHWERTHGEPGAVIAVASPKGGAGTTSIAVQLAQRAANAGLRAVYVDMNRGQGGGRILLRQAGRTDLPSVYDLAVARDPDPEQAIIAPDRLNDGRSRQFAKIGFAAVLAPPEGLPEHGFLKAGAAAYRAVTGTARDLADLVIVDTATLAQHDTTGLASHVLVPGLRDKGWWGLLLHPAGDTEAGCLLERRLRQLQDAGIGQDRLMYAATLRQDGQAAPPPGLSRYAYPVPEFGCDPAVRKALASSRFAEASPAVAPALDAVLRRVTGNPAFAAAGGTAGTSRLASRIAGTLKAVTGR